MIRVAFVLRHGENEWTGGITYIINLIKAVLSSSDRYIEPVLFLPQELSLDLSDVLSGVEILRTPILTYKGRDPEAEAIGEFERILLSKGIDVISHRRSISQNSKIGNLYWIPDFQHIRMPQFFSDAEIRDRNDALRREAEIATRVIVSSYDALGDLNAIFPASSNKAVVLRFVSGMMQSITPLSLSSLTDMYGLSGPYFHLPNQYWVHKNHKAVIDAIRILKQEGRRISVVSTGAGSDYRQPGHFESICRLIDDVGVEADYRVLGIVPYEHVISLMWHSIAVINPSYFEGWSTTVEEAKFMRKEIVLSNIPVHREQAPENGIYFDPDSSNDLADILWTLQSRATAGQAGDAAWIEAMERNSAAYRAFGAAYQKIVLDAVSA